MQALLNSVMAQKGGLCISSPDVPAIQPFWFDLVLVKTENGRSHIFQHLQQWNTYKRSTWGLVCLCPSRRPRQGTILRSHSLLWLMKNSEFALWWLIVTSLVLNVASHSLIVLGLIHFLEFTEMNQNYFFIFRNLLLGREYYWGISKLYFMSLIHLFKF